MTSTPALQANTPKRVSKMGSNQALNVNHLLNFTLPPRQTRPLTAIPRRSRRTGNVQGVWNKERFVNAQYRFVMDPTGDYTVHFADPDIFFQWQDILQVIIPRSSALSSTADTLTAGEGHTTCPICLSPPSAPRMTKCGHVFCFPCILHYLSTSDNKWARCPICFDSVNERQLKAVKWYDGPPRHDDIDLSAPASASSSSSSLDIDFPFDTTAPSAGSTLHMRLIQRPQITTLALPRSSTWPSDLLPPHQAPFHFLPDVFAFAKFLLATPAYLISDLTRNLDELAAERRTLSGIQDELGIVFIDAANGKVRQQIAKAAALETSALKDKIERAKREQKEIEDRAALHERRVKAQMDPQAKVQPLQGDIPEEFLALKAHKSSTPLVDNKVKPSPQPRSAPRQRKNINPPPPSTSTYYYYQAASGLPLFLHPLDIKILLAHFSEYALFPNHISVRVAGAVEGSVNEDLRKRCKYLAHLPEGADVVFVEADLEGVIGSEGLKAFEGPLRMRAARRREKGRKDDKARVRAEEREREKERVALGWSTGNVRTGEVEEVMPVDDYSALLHHARDGQDVRVHTPSLPQPQSQQAPGAWGARSFASALHSSPAASRAATNVGQPRPGRRDPEEEWDVDSAWHELEQQIGGGRKKRGAKLVVLGSGGGARRR